MTRRECLDAAAQCVLQDRATSYGGPEQSFADIAYYWNGHLGGRLAEAITPADVAAMMALLKLARLKANPSHTDSAVDLVGYGACYAEVAIAAGRA